MRRPVTLPILAVLLCTMSWTFAAAQTSASDDPVMNALVQELKRSIDLLGKQPNPPYYISYQITEVWGTDISSSFGAISSEEKSRQRFLDIDLRIGSPAFDNSRVSQTSGGSLMRSSAAIPLDSGLTAIRNAVWLHTDRVYKGALEDFLRARTDTQVRVAREDTSHDFSSGPAVTHWQKPGSLAIDSQDWKKRVRSWSEPFRKSTFLQSGTARFSASLRNIWFVNTEGTRLCTVHPRYVIGLNAHTRADDGMDLPLFYSVIAHSPEKLPSDSLLFKHADTLISRLEALRVAPVVEPFTGPAILLGEASGVFFHEVLGHRFEAQRMKSDNDGQTFLKKVGETVFPEILSVHANPLLASWGETDLNGHYLFDDEGIAAQKVVLVDRGVLKNFQVSRAPIRGFTQSNGHGRKAVGHLPTSRQSNFVVESHRSVPGHELKRMLIERCRKEGKSFGLIFAEITGGFTNTGRIVPNAFNVTPVLVYRLYTDSKEELVRGVDLIGTPLSVLNTLIATDDTPTVFNGTCGAESGPVPVSAIAPALLLGTIEVQKKAKSQEKLPLLQPPPLQPTERTPL